MHRGLLDDGLVHLHGDILLGRYSCGQKILGGVVRVAAAGMTPSCLRCRADLSILREVAVAQADDEEPLEVPVVLENVTLRNSEGASRRQQ